MHQGYWNRKCFCRKGFLVSDACTSFGSWSSSCSLTDDSPAWENPQMPHPCCVRTTDSDLFLPIVIARETQPSKRRHLFLHATRSIHSCVCEACHFVQARNPRFGDLTGLPSRHQCFVNRCNFFLKFMQRCNPSSITIGNEILHLAQKNPSPSCAISVRQFFHFQSSRWSPNEHKPNPTEVCGPSFSNSSRLPALLPLPHLRI